MKLSRFFASALLSMFAIAIPVTAYAGFYPGDRPTYQCVTPDNCPGADHVVFDSFTNNPVVGDERPFVAGNINGNGAVQDRLNVKDGDTIVVRAYVHNNADQYKMGGEANTVAKNVNIRFIVPTAEQNDTNIIGFISASNANPAMINDTMSVYANDAFTLQYVPGSAQFSRKADGVHQITTTLNDSIVTANGASLGDINGCFQYSGYVTLSVKVHMKPVVTPPKPVFNCTVFNIIGDNNSRKVTVTKFATTQSGGATFKNVVINWGQAGSTDYVGTNPVGQTFTFDEYKTYTVTATAHFTVPGQTQDGTDSTGCVQKITFTKPGVPPVVVTPPTVTPPTELPNTGAGDVIGIAAAAMVAGTIGYRLLLSRRLGRRS